MKNFTFLFKTLLLTCLLTAWGGVEMKASEVYTIDLSSISRPDGFPSDGSSVDATVSFSAVDENTNHSATWTITQTSATEGSYYWAWDSSAGVHMGSSSVHCTSAVVTTESFTSYAVNKITVSARENSSTTTDISVKVGDVSFLCEGSGTARISTNLTNYVFENSTGVTGTIEITYTVSSGTAVYFNGVTIEDDAADKSPHLTYSESYVGCYTDECETIELPNLEYVEGFTAVDEINYSSDNTEVATVETDGTVTLTGTTGSTTIHASFDGNDDYDASYASYEILVGDPHTFNFQVKRYGMTVKSGNEYETDIYDITGLDDVAIHFDGNHRLWDNNGIHLRVHANADFVVNAPEGRTITTIAINGSSLNNLTASEEYDFTSGGSNRTWTGDAESVTFTSSNTTQIYYIDVTLAEATSGTITISSVEYATYYTDAEYTMPTGLVGTTVTSVNAGTDDTDFTLTMPWEYAAGETIPAGTALVLQGAVGTYTYAITSTGAEAVSGNLLLGSETETTTTAPNGADANDYYFYKLADGEKGLGFYWDKTDGAAYTSGANKAWLAIPKTEATNVKFLSFGSEEDGTTGIQAVSTSHADSDAIYTLQGVRVNNMNQKGVYIVGSKKIIVK